MSDSLRVEMERLEAEVSSLVADCDIPLQDGSAIRAYLGHREIAVALEALCDTLIDTGAQITEGQCRRILDAAKALGLLTREPKEWSERMETLLTRVVGP